MSDLRIPSTSVQYVQMRVDTTVNPTSNLVSMAVTPRGTEPVAGDFKTATWAAGTPYKAQVLIGTGSSVGVLAEGVYQVWVKVTATPEIPVMQSTNCLRIT